MILDRFTAPVKQRATSSWESLNARLHGYPRYMARAIGQFNARGMTEAVAFAYWSLFSLFPLIVLAIIGISALFGPRHVVPEVFTALGEFIPNSASTWLRTNIDQVVAHRVSSSVISILGLLLGSSRLFTELQRSLSRIFDDQQRLRWHHRTLRGLLMILVFVLLTVVSVDLSSSFRAISLQFFRRQSLLQEAGALLILLVTNTLIFVLLFRYIPQRKIAWRVLIPVTICGAIAYQLSRTIFDWYLLNVANLGVVYGSVSTVIGLLTWLFLIGCIILICAEVAVATDDWRLARNAPIPVSDQVAPQV